MMSNTPKQIKTHQGDYKNDAWRQYTPEELGQWVALLLKRASHRSNEEKRLKDLYDASNYLAMLQAHLEEAKSKE